MKTEARLVIVGAGMVGCSAAYHLAQMGYADVLVVDRGLLPKADGSGIRAFDGIVQTDPSRMMATFAKYTARLLSSLELEGQPCFLKVGGLEVSTSEARDSHLKWRLGLARSWGIPAELVSPASCQEVSPLLDAGKIRCGLWTATDGIAKPARAIVAMIRSAQARGIDFAPQVEVLDVLTEQGRVTGLETSAGRIVCEQLLVCCGIEGARLGKMAGVPLPLVFCEHSYGWTNDLPELADATEEATHALLRCPDRSSWYRQHRHRYGIGTYGHEPRFVDADAIRPFDGTRILPSPGPFRREDLAPAGQATHDLLPSVADAGILDGFSDLSGFTPDGGPLLGESMSVRGFWVAEAVPISQAGGVGKTMAEWIVAGEPEWDIREGEINRFAPHQRTSKFVRCRGGRHYREACAIVHPLRQMDEPRGLRRSPFFTYQKNAGAAFFDASGFECPQWYEQNRRLLAGRKSPSRDEWGSRHWSPLQGAEHDHVRKAAGLFDLTAFTKIRVAGHGSCAFLQKLSSNDIDRPAGTITYTSMLNRRGGIMADLAIARLAPQKFLLLASGTVGMHGLGWLRGNAPCDGSVIVEEVTSQYCAVGLWGPKARAILQSLTDDDLSDAALPYHGWKEVLVDYVPAMALRLSCVGEPGFEIHTRTEFGGQLWELLLKAGEPHDLILAGAGAMDSLRIEKGHRRWGLDIDQETHPLEAGLAGAVRFNKGDFIGRSRLLELKMEPLARRLCCLTVDDPEACLLGKEPIYANGEVVGHVTSANYGYTVGKWIAYGYLPSRQAEPGTLLAIEDRGRRFAAVVAHEPLFDPGGARLKA